MARDPLRAMGYRREMLEAPSATCALTNETQAKRAFSTVSAPIFDGRVRDAVDGGAVADHRCGRIEKCRALRTRDTQGRVTSGRGKYSGRL